MARLLTEKDILNKDSRGREGIIFRLSPSEVVKIFYRTRGLEVTEMDLAFKLHLKGVSIPRPFGLDNFVWGGEPMLGFVMELIDGVNGERLMKQDIKTYNHAANKYSHEITKARVKGFIPIDVNPKNFIYRKADDRVFLCDFARWGYSPQL